MSERHIYRCKCGSWRYMALTCRTCDQLTMNLTAHYATARDAAGQHQAQARPNRSAIAKRK